VLEAWARAASARGNRSWQVVPRRFIELIRDKDPKRVKAVMDAMMTIVKLDVAALERADNEA
jgi:hypothetical protein